MNRPLIICCILILFSVATLRAQDTIPVPPSSSYAFIAHDVNQIENRVTLSPFFEKLYRLRKEHTGKINIVQIGDSHIQADFLSNAVRQYLQKEFGNGGRGLIFPGRLAHTNEPSTIYSTSPSKWENRRIVNPDNSMPVGIGCLAIKTNQSGARFTIKTISSDGLSYDFDRLTVFYQKDQSSFNMAVKDSVGRDVAYVGPYTFEAPNQSSVQLPYPIREVTFQMLQSALTQNQFTLFGINLINSKPGIVYHSLGGNGAKFRHYLATPLFFEQTSLLFPELVIISLGTNEAIEYPYVDPKFTDQLNEFVKRIKTSNPEALIMLTLPSDFYKKKTRRNPGVEVVRNKIIDYANKNNLAYWDLYQTAGGKHSADLWKRNHLLQSDGIHFTKVGYQLQGQLLYEALIKGFNEYVRYRYP